MSVLRFRNSILLHFLKAKNPTGTFFGLFLDFGYFFSKFKDTFHQPMCSLVEKTVLIDDSDIDLFIQRRFLEVYEFSKQLLLYKSASKR